MHPGRHVKGVAKGRTSLLMGSLDVSSCAASASRLGALARASETPAPLTVASAGILPSRVAGCAAEVEAGCCAAAASGSSASGS